MILQLILNIIAVCTAILYFNVLIYINNMVETIYIFFITKLYAFIFLVKYLNASLPAQN